MVETCKKLAPNMALLAISQDDDKALAFAHVPSERLDTIQVSEVKIHRGDQ